MLVGAYYYATPTSDRRRVVHARAQARKPGPGRRAASSRSPATALDLETEATRLGKADLTRWSIAWLRTVEKRRAHHGSTPYTRCMERRLLPDPRLLRFPLWHANWGLFTGSAPCAGQGLAADHARIWQFTSTVDCGSGSRDLDLNVYRGRVRSYWLRQV